MLWHSFADPIRKGLEMSVILTSYIAQLLYKEAPNLNFAQLVGDIRNAFATADLPTPVLTWDCDDIALLDFGTSRVVIGFSEDLPGAFASCLTVATDQKLMCRAVKKRLNRRFPGGENQSQVLDQPLTPDLIDRVVDALFEQADLPLLTTVGAAAEDAFPEVSTEAVVVAPADTDLLLSRLSSELTSNPVNLISRAIASVAVGVSQDSPSLSQTAPSATNAKRLSSGVFWRKPSGFPIEPQRANSNASTELSAVRQALCARDSHSGKSRFATQTMQALLSLVSSVTDNRGGASSLTSLRGKH